MDSDDEDYLDHLDTLSLGSEDDGFQWRVDSKDEEEWQQTFVKDAYLGPTPPIDELPNEILEIIFLLAIEYQPLPILTTPTVKGDEAKQLEVRKLLNHPIYIFV